MCRGSIFLRRYNADFCLDMCSTYDPAPVMLHPERETYHLEATYYIQIDFEGGRYAVYDL